MASQRGESSAMLASGLTKRAMTRSTRVTVTTPISRVFLKVTPMVGSGPIAKEAEAPRRSYQTQRQTTSGTRARNTRKIRGADAVRCLSELVASGSRRLLDRRLYWTLYRSDTILQLHGYVSLTHAGSRLRVSIKVSKD
jgi:hypothetical protein